MRWQRVFISLEVFSKKAGSKGVIKAIRGTWSVTYKNRDDVDLSYSLNTKVVKYVDANDTEDERRAAERGEHPRPSARPERVRSKIFLGCSSEKLRMGSVTRQGSSFLESIGGRLLSVEVRLHCFRSRCRNKDGNPVSELCGSRKIPLPGCYTPIDGGRVIFLRIDQANQKASFPRSALPVITSITLDRSLHLVQVQALLLRHLLLILPLRGLARSAKSRTLNTNSAPWQTSV